MHVSDLSDMITAVAVIAVITLSAVFAYGSIRAVNVWSFRAKNSARESAPNYDGAAIERLQASVDAISIEVERISEGQRFTTKLMNERIPEPARITPARDQASGLSQ